MNHESKYRGENAFKKMEDFKICVCGAGALGSNLVNILVRQGFKSIAVIDMDRVEKHNLATQIYASKHIGALKTTSLRGIAYDTNQALVEGIHKELTAQNAKKLLSGYNLVVDVFDNWASRRAVKEASKELNLACLHAGMSDNGFSEIKWDEDYNIPNTEVKQEDVCDYPLAANLVHFTVAVLAETITQFALNKIKNNREITLKDISLHNI